MIYLDYAATTPLATAVDEAMRPFGQDCFGNPSSAHGAGRAARAALDAARDDIADVLGARPAEIVFTSGGTEADNLAIKGVAWARWARGRHIVTTAIEHHAVLASCQALEREGYTVTRLLPDATGVVSAASIAQALTSDTILVSVMFANNETGVIQPVGDIGRVCRNAGIPFHCDAVQAAGELSLRVDELPVDLMTVSAHKIYGPKGTGLLYVRGGTRLLPLIDGGGQEEGRRAGTENVAGIVGMAAAMRERPDDKEITRIRMIRDRLLDGLLAIPASRQHGSPTHRLSTHANVGFTGVPGDRLLVALDLEEIAASSGAACSAGAMQPSHVLRALGLTPAQAGEAIRFSLGRNTTREEIDRVIEVTTSLVLRLRTRR